MTGCNKSEKEPLFERTALSWKPDKLIRQEIKQLREEDKVTPDLVFRDPYNGQSNHTRREFCGGRSQSIAVAPIFLQIRASAKTEHRMNCATVIDDRLDPLTPGSPRPGPFL